MLNVILTDPSEDYCSPKPYKKEQKESRLMEHTKPLFLILFHQTICFQFFIVLVSEKQ